MNWFTYIYERLEKKSYSFLFFLFLTTKATYLIITSVIANEINPNFVSATPAAENAFAVFGLSVIIAPLVETFVFQLLIIEIALKFKIKMEVAIVISSFLFALSHDYNWVYIVVMLVSGFLFAFYYVILRKRDIAIAFLWVVLLHASWNFIAFLNNEVVKWF